MKNIITGLVVLLAFTTMSAQTYKAKGLGMSSFGYIFTDSTITSTKKGKILSVDTGFKKTVTSNKISTYYKIYDDGGKEIYKVVETSKNNVHIFITTIDALTEEKFKHTLRAKRIN